MPAYLFRERPILLYMVAILASVPVAASAQSGLDARAIELTLGDTYGRFNRLHHTASGVVRSR